MASNFDKVSRMNEAFNNAKGHPALFDIERLAKQLLSVPDELGETFVAMGADKQRVDALVVLFKAGLAALDFPNRIDVNGVRDGITDQHVFLYGAQHLMGVNADADMDSVIGGVMTRFIKNEEDEIATIKKHAAKGVTDVYFEGDYPTKVMKSAADQPDAPKGKFMKSASFKEPVFYPVDEHCSVSGRVFKLDDASPTMDENSAGVGEWLEGQGEKLDEPVIMAAGALAPLPVIDVKFEVVDRGHKRAPAEFNPLEINNVYSFDEFVQYGRDHGANIVNGMPWSFDFYGTPVSHENDQRYLINTRDGTLNFTPGDLLAVDIDGVIGIQYGAVVVGNALSEGLRRMDKIVGEMNEEARKLLDRHNESIGAAK